MDYRKAIKEALMTHGDPAEVINDLLNSEVKRERDKWKLTLFACAIGFLVVWLTH